MAKKEYGKMTADLFTTMSQLNDPDDIIEIRNRVVQLNLPLVSTVLQKYRPYSQDQFQIGCIGLIKAADTYEQTLGVPFSNYACFVIEREIHMDYRLRMDSFEGKNQNNFLYLDAKTTLENGDESDNGSLIADDNAVKYMEQFIEDNALQQLCDELIRPAIKEVADKGRNLKAKVDFDHWEKLEFMYIMAIVFEESQKKRYNLTQMARECNISLQNVRSRHIRVMDNLFQRMWGHMTLTFTEVLARIRGGHKVPERLLCLDPGKTTGWCVFEQGKLTQWGQLEDCYDDDNIDAKGMTALLKAVKPDFILYEDYRVYSHKLERHSYSKVNTVRLIGVIETYCQMEEIASHSQMAVTAKNFCTDAKLEQWGFWQKGMRHARDAIRHGCYFLLFYKKGQDIL